MWGLRGSLTPVGDKLCNWVAFEAPARNNRVDARRMSRMVTDARTVKRGLVWLAAAVMWLCAPTLVGGCSDDPGGVSASTRRPGPMRVVVTIPPLMWAAREMLPPDAEVVLILPPGQSEHGFEITPSQFRAINDADLVVMVGHGLEPKVDSTLALANRPWRRVVNFEKIEGIEEIAGEGCAPGCDHGHHHHSHAADPHLWLDPVAMGVFVERVGAAVKEVVLGSAGVDDPDARRSAAARVDETVARRKAECDAMDRAYRERLAGVSSNRIVTHHNAYSYIARRYGLEVAAVLRPIEVVEPTPGDLRQVTTAIREGGVRAIFVEPQFSGTAAERVAQATGIKVLTIDPLGDGDWAAMMRANLDALVLGLSE